MRRAGNYGALHLTSHLFDEPLCLALLSNCDLVVAIHGCQGAQQSAPVGGLDDSLAATVTASRRPWSGEESTPMLAAISFLPGIRTTSATVEEAGRAYKSN